LTNSKTFFLPKSDFEIFFRIKNLFQDSKTRYLMFQICFKGLKPVLGDSNFVLKKSIAGEKPKSSGLGKRLLTKRLWVRTLAPLLDGM
jgi:hypothetical protein